MLARKKIDGGLERLILLGIVTNTQFLDKISKIIEIEAFKNDGVRRIVEWCLEYYTKQRKAPVYDINAIWDEKSLYLTSDEWKDTESILMRISDEMDRRKGEFNCTFALEQAVRFFQKKKIEASIEEIQDLLDDGDIDGIRQVLLDARIPDVESEKIESTSILSDSKTIQNGFELEGESLIYFPSALGEFINPLLKRGGFISFLAPEKRGKTWHLNEIAIQAIRCRCKVAYFNLGDMDNEEQSVRFATRISKKPSSKQFCGDIYVPVLDCAHNQNNTCTKECRRCSIGTDGMDINTPSDVDLSNPNYVPCRECANQHNAGFKGTVWYRKIHVPNPLTWKEAYHLNRRFIETRGKGINEQDFFRMRSFASDSLTVEELDAILEKWVMEDGFAPDVIVLDYMDLMASSGKFRDFRHNENHKWKRVRGISNKYNCLVVTATQADACYGQETITEDNYSEDKRKYSHVTGILTLNQTDREAELGIMRIGRFMTRKVERTRKQVRVLQCLARGQIHIGSFF